MEEKKNKGGRKASRHNANLREYKETRRKRKTNAMAFAYRRLLMGFDFKDIVNAVMEQYGYSEDGANAIYYDAYKIYEKQIVKESPVIITENMKKLEAIQQEAFESGDLSNTLKAIDIANKMVGAYTEKIDVNAKEEIKIDFGF